VPRNDKTLGLPSLAIDFKSAKFLSRKKNRVTLTPRDVFKPAAIVRDVVDFVRCSGAGGWLDCRSTGHLRASRRALCSATTGSFSAKSFDGARVYQWQRGVADN
jgi:hypothetical protein